MFINRTCTIVRECHGIHRELAHFRSLRPLVRA